MVFGKSDFVVLVQSSQSLFDVEEFPEVEFPPLLVPWLYVLVVFSHHVSAYFVVEHSQDLVLPVSHGLSNENFGRPIISVDD